MVPQQSTWGRFCVSQEAFQRILKAHKVFSAFVDIVQAFGHRLADAQHYKWSGCHVCASDDLATTSQKTCYGE